MLNYTLERLQFGSNTQRVPCHEQDLTLSQPVGTAPIDLGLVCGHDIWDLVFSYASGGFYLAGASVTPQDGEVIESWYAKEGPNGGPHALTFLPFIVDQNGGGFAQASHFVDFSDTPTSDTSINTDTIPHATVTATVHADLPEYASFAISSHANNQSVTIQISTTQATFQNIFVYYGNQTPVANSLTVAKGQSCSALAVFKKTTQTSSSDLSTIQYPVIPAWEWPIIVSEIVQSVVAKGSGDIYEFLSPRLIQSLGPEQAKKAVADITRRIASLGQIKSVISGLTQAAGK
jgi:hypothetical protein